MVSATPDEFLCDPVAGCPLSFSLVASHLIAKLKFIGQSRALHSVARVN